MASDSDGSEITAPQWLKDLVKERFDASEKDRIRRLKKIRWENFEEISKATGIWKGKSGHEAMNLRLRFSTKVLTALGALHQGWGKDDRSDKARDIRARLSSYKDAVKTLQLIFPPYQSRDKPSSEAEADSLPEKVAGTSDQRRPGPPPDIQGANTLLMAAMSADEGWEYSEFRTLLPLLLKKIEKAEQYAQRDYEKQEKEKGGRPKGHDAGIAVDTFVYDFCRAVLSCGGKFAHSRKGANSSRYVGTLIEFMREDLPSEFPHASEIERLIETKGKEAKDFPDREAERVFLALLQQFERENMVVSHLAKANNYAPKVFAQHPNAEGIGEAYLAKAMNVFLKKKRIEIVEYDSPSRRFQRLALKEEAKK